MALMERIGSLTKSRSGISKDRNAHGTPTKKQYAIIVFLSKREAKIPRIIVVLQAWKGSSFQKLNEGYAGSMERPILYMSQRMAVAEER